MYSISKTEQHRSDRSWLHTRHNAVKKLQEVKMKQSVYNSYDELPLMLSVREIAKVLGISKTSAYELVRRKGFPVLKIGSRLVVPKENSVNGWRKTQEEVFEI